MDWKWVSVAALVIGFFLPVLALDSPGVVDICSIRLRVHRCPDVPGEPVL
jgi:hypothetical protein